MSNNNTTSVQAEQPPAAVQYAINLHAVRMQRKAKIEANVGDINTKLAGLKAQADELLKMRGDLWKEQEAVELDANVALEMAHAACRTHGWAVPEAQDEPPLTQTGQFPAVQPGDATQVIPAVPSLDVRDGQDVIVRMKDGTQQPGRIVGIIPHGFKLAYGTQVFPILTDDVESVEPADAATEVIDRVTTTPAQDGSRADG